MKTIRIIEEIYGKIPKSTQNIPSGLTNKNTLIEINDLFVVLREPKEENKHLFNYPLEKDILEHVSDLDTTVRYFDAETGIKISDYVHNAETFELKYIKEAAQLIKKLHDKQYLCGTRFDIIERFESFYVDNSLHHLKPYIRYLHDAQSASTNLTLCHNDLVKGNFLFSDSGNYLIDYEYACDNDPYFDIMSFITENDIQDQDHRNEFYESYFGHLPTPEEQSKLKIFERAHHILWCQWACLMHQLYPEPIYKDIADLKYQRLMETL